MSMRAGNAYQLVDGLLDNGLVFVAAYLEKTIKRSVLIADHRGLIHYPNLPANTARVNNIYIQIPGNIDSRKFYYQKTDRSLFYPIDSNGNAAYIIVKNLPAEMVCSTAPILAEAKLAVKCYFANLSKDSENRRTLSQKLGEYLFSGSRSIHDVLDQDDLKWNGEAPCYVCVIEADDYPMAVDWEQIAASFHEFLKGSQPKTIVILNQHCLIAVLPGCQNDSSPDTIPGWHCLTAFRESIAASSNQDFSLAVGGAHPFIEVKKSFHEARLALTLSRLLGKRSAVQSFANLGLATLLFSADSEDLKGYCHASLGNVLDYDRSNHSELLASLRKLLDNNFNWKSTADHLFIHINTLYYRMSKIEQLLNIDLSRMETRVNMYIAIKVWDVLNLNGLLPE